MRRSTRNRVKLASIAALACCITLPKLTSLKSLMLYRWYRSWPLSVALLVYFRSDLFVTPSDIDHGPENPGNGIFVDGAKQQPAARAAVAADNNGIAARGVRLPDSNGGVSDNRRAREVEVRHTPPPPSPPPYVEHVEAPPDFRDPVCPAFVDRIRGSGAVLPNTSVIFCFCNEPRSSLYHSIHSVIDRSPQHLLHEIILVDDGSDAPHLQQPLEDYVAALPVPVHVVRQGGRTGLMKARVAGARRASGVTLTFLDSHIDASRDWLEPLMHRIAEDRRHVVMPVIDGLSREFKYTPGGVELVGFNTRLVDHGISLQKIHRFDGRTAADPEPSPAMAGGLFSIHREYFFEIGAFDETMEHWGGENIEIGFRVWQCGGSIELIRCSRVAHVFGGMGAGCGWPGPPPGTKNKWRAIRAWMDEYADLMQQFLPEPADLGDMTYYTELRTRLQCKSFAWFLEHVYPECWINVVRHPVRQGLVFNNGTRLCFSPRTHTVVPCVSPAEARSRGHWFYMSPNDELIMSDVDTCVEAPTWGSDQLSSWACHGKRGNQEWVYDAVSGLFRHEQRCLAVDSATNGVLLAECNATDLHQVWAFVGGGA